MATTAGRTTAQASEDRVALITGGRRVGGELALSMATRGWRVAMTYHTSRAAIEQTIRSVEAGGSAGLAIAADLARPEQAANAINQVITRFGRLDALVSMASVYRRTPLADLRAHDFDDMIAGNLAAPYHTALAAARQMLLQPGVDGIRGKIIVIGDWATDRPYKDYLPYLVAKGALKTMTMALAKELAPYVTVAMIQPAMIEPPPDFTEADKAAVVAATPLHRIGSPDDVNRLILYLLEGTNFVTGACFRVDGGRFLGEDLC
jgi:pteridine reductase